MQDGAFKGVWIPAEIWLSEELSIHEKVLFAEIANFCSRYDSCFASNEHFCKLLGVKERRLQDLLKSLETKGFIKREIIYKPGTKQVDKRLLKTSEGWCRKMQEGGAENCGRGGAENCAENNTSINNTREYNKSSQIESSNLVSIAPSGTDTATTIPQKVQDAYQQEIRPICSQFEQERLNEDVEHYGEEVVIKAIHRAAIRGKRNLGYVEGILRRWETEGYDEEGNNGQGFGKAAGKRQRKYDPEHERDKWAGETSGWK